MKHLNTLLLFISLVLAVVMQTAAAQNLCSTSCELTISFSDGGSIEAIEALIITFGEGGFINDGAVTTGYARDENLQLNAGDSLVFSTGGELNLGNAGNIDYSAMNLVANGDIILSALSGGSVSLHGTSSFTVSGTLELNSDLIVSAELDLSGSSGATPSSSATLMSGTGSITVEAGASGSILLGNNQIISSSTPTLSLIEINQIQAPNLGTIDPIVISPIELTPIVITPITQANLVDMQGVAMTTDDDNQCTIQNGVCIDSQGNTYVLLAGRFVLQQDNSGSFEQFSLLLLFSVFLFSHFRRFT